MTGTIVVAVFVLRQPQVGGPAGLHAKLPGWAFRFTPEIGGTSGPGGTLVLTVSAFLAYVGMQWWAACYPGAEPGFVL